MKIRCSCGAMIVDQSEWLPDKAQVIPDESFFPLLDAMTRAIRQSGPSAEEKEAAADHVRQLVIDITKCIYQCAECGRIYVDGPRGTRIAYEFVPANEATPRELLKAPPVAPTLISH